MDNDARQQRHRTLERDAFKALQKDAGIPHPPTKETYDFRLAVSGQGCLAYQWADKPHRLLYDACSIIEREAALRQSQTDALKKAREAFERIKNRKWNTLIQGCDAAVEAFHIARDTLAALEQSK